MRLLAKRTVKYLGALLLSGCVAVLCACISGLYRVCMFCFRETLAEICEKQGHAWASLDKEPYEHRRECVRCGLHEVFHPFLGWMPTSGK